MNSYLYYSLLVLEIIGLIVGPIACWWAIKELLLSYHANHANWSKEKLKQLQIFSPVGIYSLAVVICSVTVTLWSLPFFVESVSGHHMMLAKSGEIRKIFEKPTFMWQKNYDKLSEEAEFLNYDFAKHRSLVAMTVTPITDNPKVRKITYQVQVGWINTPEAYAAYWKETAEFREGILMGNSWVSNFTRRLDRFVRYNLYDFNEEKSKELARFFNPDRSEQQKEFRDLVQNFLGEKFKRAGVQITWAEFSLMD
ncbi:MAG: hypothetical protein A3B11_01655 [Candidatus Taylorbacteria bacterium RIFCSPLOWO2_01_FULL_44_26]|uniref:Uncharacterized protein n=1 Tax=Candidatus Taylorbacteria bacterium RIFCSPLOWO2_01_FULL_44_26 TaxID=1802318 RepID=A0A1G2N595_9BACT|nr:MAG: hypothetical protein A3B11_01655 [Candidatus Taylorbacteria bacterium RIFCSPLOWO2_01_FULL_44_26]